MAETDVARHDSRPTWPQIRHEIARLLIDDISVSQLHTWVIETLTDTAERSDEEWLLVRIRLACDDFVRGQIDYDSLRAQLRELVSASDSNVPPQLKME